MKPALLTANIGCFDNVIPPIEQTEKFDYFSYSDNNLPSPLPCLNNRLKGKYLKTQSHRFINHNIIIWIDGSVEIKSEYFIAWVKEQVNKHDIIICRHFDRNNVYQEIEFIQDLLKEEDPYIMKRYAEQPFQEEYDFYLKEGMPEDFPLFNCWFFARRNNEKINKFFDHWWDMVLRFSNFDQTQFSYCAWKDGIDINIVDAKDYLERKKHK